LTLIQIPKWEEGTKSEYNLVLYTLHSLWVIGPPPTLEFAWIRAKTCVEAKVKIGLIYGIMESI
jgi:hypothetical protein